MNETWDRMKENGKVLLNGLSEKTDIAIERGRLQFCIMEAKQNRNKQYTALGELTATLLATGQNVAESAEAAVLCERIQNYSTQISEWKMRLSILEHRD